MIAPQPHLLFDGVGRRFGSQTALEDVSVAVPPGRIHALLGPNGAGKTTFLRLAAGLLTPTAGTVRVLGEAPGSASVRPRIGWVPSEDRSFYMRLTGRQNLVFFGRLEGLAKREASERAEQALHALGLADAADRRSALYSHGMLKRLGFARALLRAHDLFLIDEATHDLDPAASRSLAATTRRLADQGAAVVWSTHRLAELVGFVDSVTVLDRGRVAFHGDLDNFLAGAQGQVYRLTLRDPQGGDVPSIAAEASVGRATVVSTSSDGRTVTVRLEPGHTLDTVLRRVMDAGLVVEGCTEDAEIVEQALMATLERTS